MCKNSGCVFGRKILCGTKTLVDIQQENFAQIESFQSFEYLLPLLIAYLPQQPSATRTSLNMTSMPNNQTTTSIVSGAFKEMLKVEINPSQIDLRQEITQVGKYKINVNLHAEVTAIVNLQVDKIDSI